jgi:hypothetical protein
MVEMPCAIRRIPAMMNFKLVWRITDPASVAVTLKREGAQLRPRGGGDVFRIARSLATDSVSHD